MSAIFNYFFPSLGNSNTIERNPPRTIEEAASQAEVFVRKFDEKCQEAHPWLHTFTVVATDVNNKLVTVCSDERVQMVGSIASKWLVPALTGYLAEGSLFYRLGCAGVGCLVATVGCKILEMAPLKPRLPVLGAQSEAIERVIKETKQIPDLRFSSLVEASFVHTGIKKVFIDRVICDMGASIPTNPLSRRFIYEIKWQGKVTGYLIGTIHEANSAMANDPILLNTVKKCCRLIVETDPDKLKLGGTIKKWTTLSPMRYAVDCELVRTAFECGIPIEALEAWDFQNDLVKSLRSPSVKQVTTSDPYVLARCKHSEKHLKLELFDAYQRGDSKEVALIGECTSKEARKSMLTDRNNEWLRGKPNLINRLKPAATTPSSTKNSFGFLMPSFFSFRSNMTSDSGPIGIAVGVLHCLGKEDGMVLQMRKEGLEVTKKEQGV